MYQAQAPIRAEQARQLEYSTVQREIQRKRDAEIAERARVTEQQLQSYRTGLREIYSLRSETIRTLGFFKRMPILRRLSAEEVALQYKYPLGYQTHVNQQRALDKKRKEEAREERKRKRAEDRAFWAGIAEKEAEAREQERQSAIDLENEKREFNTK